jgi:2-beta-glucuronyltransferase
MKRVVLFSGHYLRSKRKAGFHWLADAYWRHGWEVIFVTAPITWVGFFRGDYRFEYPVIQEANKLTWIRERLGSYVYLTTWRPANLRVSYLNDMSRSLFSKYGKHMPRSLKEAIETANLIIFESTPALVMFDYVKNVAPQARYVYRMSDSIRLMRLHPVVIETEERIAHEFDLISVPSFTRFEEFSHLDNVSLDPHGIRKELFDQEYRTPYDTGTVNVVYSGANSLRFDLEFAKMAADIMPDWRFHFIGPIPGHLKGSNIYAYGEMPFEDTIPYIKHADMGLHPIKYSPGAEGFTDTLKVQQYTYCRLPIIAPSFLVSDRPHMFYYESGDRESVRSALSAAFNFDRSNICTDKISSWDDIAAKLAG